MRAGFFLLARHIETLNAIPLGGSTHTRTRALAPFLGSLTMAFSPQSVRL